MGNYRKATGGLSRRRCRPGEQAFVDLTGMGTHTIRNKRSDSSKLGRAETQKERTASGAFGGIGTLPTGDDRCVPALRIYGKGAKQELPKGSDALPECGDGGTYRDISRIDRSERPRLTANEQTAMAHCNRPLEIAEWREMTSERQWGGGGR